MPNIGFIFVRRKYFKVNNLCQCNGNGRSLISGFKLAISFSRENRERSLEDVGLDSEVEVFKAEVSKIEVFKTEVLVLSVKIVV